MNGSMFEDIRSRKFAEAGITESVLIFLWKDREEG